MKIVHLNKEENFSLISFFFTYKVFVDCCSPAFQLLAPLVRSSAPILSTRSDPVAIHEKSGNQIRPPGWTGFVSSGRKRR